MTDTTETSLLPNTTNTTMRSRFLWFGAGLLLGALLLLSVRFMTYNPPTVHYHANFAVYINGSHQTFASSQYYQEVKICSLDGATPQSRAHMHDEQNGVIHVHAAAVTWGAFFENLGWFVGPDFIRSDTTLYQENDTNKLNIILNGQDLTDLTTITDQVIKDKDRLLISYGPVDTSALHSQYKTVPSSAARYDSEKDPASCTGSEGSTTGERLHHLF